MQNGRVVELLSGANPPELTLKVLAFSGRQSTAAPTAVSEEAIQQRVKQLVHSSPVMAFIKGPDPPSSSSPGTPAAPQCGFSRRFIELLKGQGIQFASFNILSDPAIREGVKKYANWPTYPQLFIKGELVGGLDVCTELAETGELRTMVPAECLTGADA